MNVSGAFRVYACVVLMVGVGCGGGSPSPSKPVGGANAWSVGASFVPEGPDGAVRREGIILRSSDAGAHWIRTLTVENGDFEGVSFADASRGWVVGTNEILRSDDGGMTWSSQRAGVPVEPAMLEAVQAMSPDAVVAVGGGVPLLGTGNAASLILRTENAGATWTVAPITSGSGGDPSRTILTSVCIASTGVGLAVGSGTTTSLAVRTTDYGSSWTDVTEIVRGSSAGELFDVACLEDEFWIATNGETFVRYSSDAGESWRDAVPVALDTALTGIDAPARGVAVAVGLDAGNLPLVLRTDDAGVSWVRQRIEGVAGEGYLNDVSFVDPDDGTAIGTPSGPIDSTPSGSLTILSPTHGLEWVRGESLEGFVSLRDVARIR